MTALGDEFLHHLAVTHACQFEIKARITVGEAFVIEAEKAQQSRMKIMDVD